MDDVQESVKKLRELVQRIRPKHTNHADINKYENDVKKLMTRWNNARSQIVERYAQSKFFHLFMYIYSVIVITPYF